MMSSEHWPLIVLALGILTVLGLIIVLRVNAFLALIAAALLVSFLGPGEVGDKAKRVADAFGSSAGGIGIVIAMAAIIGKCMLDSGAADRIVRAFLSVLGEKRSPMALMGSGFVLAVPVFFDTVFYLLVPLARSLYRRTQRNYLKYLLAIGAGGAITHTLVPPTPGPLLMASNLNIDVGMMILVGLAIAAPAAIVGLAVGSLLDKWMNVPMRETGHEPEAEPLDDDQLPSLLVSLLPVLLPVILISTNTVLTTLADAEHAALLSEADLTMPAAWAAQLQNEGDVAEASPGKRIAELLAGPEIGDPTTGAAATVQLAIPADPAQLTELLNAKVLPRRDFYLEVAFLGIRLEPAAKALLGKDRSKLPLAEVERLNRLLLEAAYPDAIAAHEWETSRRQAADLSSLLGNANLALSLSAVIAMWTLYRARSMTFKQLEKAVEIALMSGGMIILITAAGGAFGAMLKTAQVGDAIRDQFSMDADSGLLFLLLGFGIAAVLKIAQGSSTVAMITGSGMLAGIATAETLGFHPVYLATAIGAGSLFGSWMNDSGFWIFAKMGGLTETEALKSWTVILVVLSLASLAMTLLLAKLMPLV
ncbi:MAG: gluconate permease [Planctomycetales bacterium]|nr:gluconate permease [Planctomycetales bacterium]